MPELSSLELFYPFALTLVACGFWSVFKLRPEMRSAFWFAISFASGAMAFGVEFFRFVIPDHTQALFGASFYNSMAACFVMGIILRASRKPPKLAIFSIAGLSALTIWILSLLDFHILIRVCLAQFTAGMLLLTALIYGRQRGQTLTDKAVLGIVSLITILLFYSL